MATEKSSSSAANPSSATVPAADLPLEASSRPSAPSLSAHARPPPSRLPRWAPLVLIAAIVVAYLNTRHAPFIYDDLLAIPDNPTIRSLTDWRVILLPPAQGGLTISGRPILNLSLALNYALSGPAPWGYHAINIALHAGSALLLWGILRRALRCPALGGRFTPSISAAVSPLGVSSVSSFIFHLFRPDALALAIAALWALHPLQTQAITYSVQRAESQMGFFYLLTLYTFCRAVQPLAFASSTSAPPLATPSVPAPSASPRPTPGANLIAPATSSASVNPISPRASPPSAPIASRPSPPARDPAASRRWLAASIAAALLGIGTKEVLATAPLLVLLYDRTFVAGTFRAAWSQRRAYYIILSAATWLALAGLLASTGGNRGGTVGLGVGLPLWAYPLTQFQALVRYLGLSLWPAPLVFEYGTFWVERARDIAPYAALLLPLLAATAWALWRRPVWGFAGAWFFLILAPTSLAPGTIQMIVEHRLYLPLAAPLAALAAGVSIIIGRRALPALAVAALALLVLTVDRNSDYRSRAALWHDTVTKRPLNPRAHTGLAEALAETGHLSAAIVHRREAVRLLPDESTYHYNLALTLAEAGQLEPAISSYRVALRLAPAEPRTHNNLALALARTGDLAGSAVHYAEAARLAPEYPLYHYNLGIALLRLPGPPGRAADAVASFERVLRLQPDHADARFNLAAALVRAGRGGESLPHYRAALAARPDARDYRLGLADALLLHGDPREALAEYQRLASADDPRGDAHFGVANALATLQRPAEALAAYRALLTRWPDHANGHFKLAGLLLRLDRDRAPEALPHYEAAVRLQPADAEAHLNLGATYAQLERWSDALRAFETALRLRPDYPAAQRNLAQLRALLQNERPR